MPEDKWLYAVITQDGLDLILETREDAVKHAAELSDLGCTTMIVPVLNDDDADEIALFIANLE